MIEGIKPYPESRKSGLPWLDEIPQHWEMIPNRALMREQKATVGEHSSDFTLLSLTLRGVIARDLENPSGKFPSSFDTYKIVRPNDFVFCLFDIDETPRGVGLSKQDGMITGAYDVFSPTSRIDPRYLYYYYLFVDGGKLMKPLYTGLRKTIKPTSFAGLKSPVPPPEEQAAIVRFLDHANRKIDGFIRAKRKLIGLLNEQKQAIIHRAVTRGLDPNVPMKSSGLDWLGEIPAHWEITRIKNEFCCLNNMRVPLSSTERGRMTTRGYDYYGASGVIDKVDNFIFDDDLLLIAEDGANLVLRNLPLAIIARGKFWVNNHAHILKPRRGNLEYFQALLEVMSYRPWITGAAQPKLTKDRLLSVAIAVPPRSEQDTIVCAFNTETLPLSTAITRTEREISLMQEYRTRLTADVVTGKLDVRDAAANLPDLTEELASDGLVEDELDQEDEGFSEEDLTAEADAT